MTRALLAALALATARVAAAADAANAALTLPTYVVTAARVSQPIEQSAALIDRLDLDGLRETPALTLDQALRMSPAFALFRRTSSLVANPTAQGVSLRAIGPSGASRSLVLLDDVPLNDPFGGWVTWSEVPRLSLASAEIVRGGGSGVWGNAALGGVVQMLSQIPARDTGAIALELGDYSTRRAEAEANLGLAPEDVLQLGGRWFSTHGFYQFAPDQRGSIDRPFDSEHRLGYGELSHSFADSTLRLSVGGRVFDEERGNGTPLQRNETRDRSLHLRLAGELRPGTQLTAVAYAQRQHFASGFSSVDTTRMAETPALDQFDVPASAYGASAVLAIASAPETRTTLGADLRGVSGDTREDFLFSNGAFQRRRVAGGDQLFAGAFVAHDRALSSTLHGQFALRADYWRETGGHRDEWVKATGAPLRADRFADRDGVEFSPSIGAVWTASGQLRVRASAYRAFRVPTLNELHRPFRVGNVSTEANPQLAPETLLGGEIAAELSARAWHFSLGGFANELSDAVANVTLSATPSATQRQRLNLDTVRVRGLEAGLSWTPVRALDVSINYQFADAHVRAASVAPALVGRRLAQVPEHTGTLQLRWRPSSAWRLIAAARAVSAQFEDDENTLRLAPAVTLDLALAWTLAPGQEVSFAIENALNEPVESTRTREGLVSYAAPRLARLGCTSRW